MEEREKAPFPYVTIRVFFCNVLVFSKRHSETSDLEDIWLNIVTIKGTFCDIQIF